MSKQKIDPDAGGPWDVGMERVLRSPIWLIR